MKKKFIFYIYCLILFASLACQSNSNQEKARQSNGFDAEKSDPKAIEVVDAMQKVLGMPDHWRQARYFSYHWIVSKDGQTLVDHRHDWDRFTNRYRLEGTNRRGQHFVALFNTETKAGEVYLDGKKVTVDSTKQKIIENSYGSFINDSYWLIMPYKLKESGVVLKYDGPKDLDGKLFDVVKVTFESVGLTPQDTYWAYIDPEDHFMKKWDFFLQGWPAEHGRSSANWEDWQDFNGIKLALNKPFGDKPVRIYFKDVKVSAQPDEDMLTSSAKTF